MRCSGATIGSGSLEEISPRRPHVAEAFFAGLRPPHLRSRAPGGGAAGPSPDDDPRVASALELARAWLDAERAYAQVPGVSAAIVHDQKVLWSGAFGLADVASGRKAEPGTIYSICSISKLFTSVAVMQLRDAGKLRLDDPVRTRLPWFTMKPGGTDGTEITVEGLLTHAAGLPRETDLPYWTGPSFAFPTHEQIVERVAQQTALYPAETYFQYSNLGLTLAGEIVSASSGVSYADYVSKNILVPLKLASTTPEMPESERGKRLASGYSALTRAGRRDPVAFFQGKGVAPAMAFASTAEDLARFASWQFRLLGGGGPEVLKTATLREMHRVHFVDPDFETMWGLGFQVRGARRRRSSGTAARAPASGRISCSSPTRSSPSPSSRTRRESTRRAGPSTCARSSRPR